MGDAVLTRLLNELADGRELPDGEYGALSDLDRAEAARLREGWNTIPVAARATLLERAAELSEVNLDLNFEQLAKVGLDDSDPEVRERAVGALWESNDRLIAEKLARLAAADPGPGVRAAAAACMQRFIELSVLGKLDRTTGAVMTDALRVALDDPDPGVVGAALESAGPIPEEWVRERILAAYEGEGRELQLSAIRAMGASGLERWVEYLEEQLESGDDEFQFESAIAAGKLGSELLVHPLGELLGQEDARLVLAVVEALGEIGGEEAVELLRKFRGDAPEELSEAIDEALESAADGGLFRRFGELEEVDE
jgi:HEAT repeat protein